MCWNLPFVSPPISQPSPQLQYGSVVWGHTATFLCSLLPKKDGLYEKKLLTLEVHEVCRRGTALGRCLKPLHR